MRELSADQQTLAAGACVFHSARIDVRVRCPSRNRLRAARTQTHECAADFSIPSVQPRPRSPAALPFSPVLFFFAFAQIENSVGGHLERLRTAVYTEILVGYLAYAQRTGFTTGHIWVCPPEKDQEFIVRCKPGHQKTPSLTLLGKW